MTYKEFNKIAEQIGDGGKCEVCIDGTHIQDALLTSQDSVSGSFKKEWYILQNKKSGFSAKDKKGYKYSWIVGGNLTAEEISYIRPVSPKKTEKKATKPVWGVSIDGTVTIFTSIQKRDEFLLRAIPSFRERSSIFTFRITDYYKVVSKPVFALEEVK